MKNQPLVSICIPCYNAAAFVAETMQSVLNQTYTNLEIIVCDDQSKDNTLAIVKQFDDPRITIYANEKNLGCSGNYNKVLSYATGTYVKLLCADDLIAHDCIAKEVAAFEDNADKNIVLVTSEKWVINKRSKKMFVKKFYGKKLMDGKKAISKSVRWGTSIFGEPGCWLIKTDILRQTSGVIDDKYFTYCNDFDIVCKILLLGNLWVIKEPLFCFRIVNTSVTSNSGWKQARIMKDYFKLLFLRKEYGVSHYSLFLGKIMANIMTIARNMIYKFMK